MGIKDLLAWDSAVPPCVMAIVCLTPLPQSCQVMRGLFWVDVCPSILRLLLWMVSGDVWEEAV